MPQFRFRIVTPAPPSRAWEIAGDPAGLVAWVPGVTECRLDGDTRTCTFADGRVVLERVAEVDEHDMSYRYEADDDAMGLTNRGRFSVRPLADGVPGSLVAWDADVEFADAAVAARMVPALDEGYGRAAASLAAVLTRERPPGP
jgi:uncharacterized protein YndB with AHSA1/START domain